MLSAAHSEWLDYQEQLVSSWPPKPCDSILCSVDSPSTRGRDRCDAMRCARGKNLPAENDTAFWIVWLGLDWKGGKDGGTEWKGSSVDRVAHLCVVKVALTLLVRGTGHAL